MSDIVIEQNVTEYWDHFKSDPLSLIDYCEDLGLGDYVTETIGDCYDSLGLEPYINKIDYLEDEISNFPHGQLAKLMVKQFLEDEDYIYEKIVDTFTVDEEEWKLICNGKL